MNNSEKEYNKKLLIVALYKCGCDHNQIEKILNEEIGIKIDEDKIHKILHFWCLIAQPGISKKDFIKDNIDEFNKLYVEDNLTIQEIGILYNIPFGTLKCYFSELGLKKQREINYVKILKEEYLKNNKTLKNVSKEYNISYHALNYHRAKHNLSKQRYKIEKMFELKNEK